MLLASDAPFESASDVALCVLGEVRTLAHPLVRDSQRRYLLAPLRAAAAHVAVFAVVAPADNLTLVAAAYGLPHAHPAHVRTLHASHLGLSTPGQFERFPLVYEMVVAAEAARGARFAWLIRARPDHYFYAPLPPLAPLDARAVHTPRACGRRRTRRTRPLVGSTWTPT